MTTILLIPTIWLAILALVLAACRMAARGDKVAHADAAEYSALRSLLRSPSLLRPGASRAQVLTLKLEERSEPAATEHVRHCAQQDLYVRP